MVGVVLSAPEAGIGCGGCVGFGGCWVSVMPVVATARESEWQAAAFGRGTRGCKSR